MDFFIFTNEGYPMQPKRTTSLQEDNLILYNSGAILRPNVERCPELFLQADEDLQHSFSEWIRSPEALEPDAPWNACLNSENLEGVWFFLEDKPRLIRKESDPIKVLFHPKERSQAMRDVRTVERIMAHIRKQFPFICENAPFLRVMNLNALSRRFDDAHQANYFWAYVKFHIIAGLAYIKWCWYVMEGVKESIEPDDWTYLEKDLELFDLRNRGVILNLKEDWARINIPFYARSKIPYYLLECEDLYNDPRFLRLNPDVVETFIEMRRAQERHIRLKEVLQRESWDIGEALSFDGYLQKLDLSYRYRHDAAIAASRPSPAIQSKGKILEYYIVDFEGWAPRKVDPGQIWPYLRRYKFVFYEEPRRLVKRVTFLGNRPARMDPRTREEHEAAETNRREMEEFQREFDCEWTGNKREILAPKFAPGRGQKIEPASGNIIKPGRFTAPSQWGISFMFHEYDEAANEMILDSGIRSLLVDDDEPPTFWQGFRESDSQNTSPSVSPFVEVADLPEELMEEIVNNNEDVSMEQEVALIERIETEDHEEAAKEDSPPSLLLRLTEKDKTRPLTIPTYDEFQPSMEVKDHAELVISHFRHDNRLARDDPPLFNLVVSYLRAVGMDEGVSMEPLRGRILPEFPHNELIDAYLIVEDSDLALLKILYYVYPGYRDLAQVLRYAISNGIHFSLAWDNRSLTELQKVDIKEAASRGETLKDVREGSSLKGGFSEALIDYGPDGGTTYRNNWMQKLKDLSHRAHIRGLAPESSVEKWIMAHWIRSKESSFIEDFMLEGPSASLTSLMLGDSTTLVSSTGEQLRRDCITTAERALIRGQADRNNGLGKGAAIVTLYPSKRLLRLYLDWYREGLWNSSINDLLIYITKQIETDNEMFSSGKTDREWKRFLQACNKKRNYARDYVVTSRDVKWGISLLNNMYPGNWSGRRIEELEDELDHDSAPSV
ncbi:hypothetical protein CYLTODRAFT_427457 [Cylindrobasidium torrendii FP15055 ss-10]|uniref:Uncharacterized protein n=1 Tax=Cylindrobasidium torrendii FP15055 ss-10 TaxID=1314674 RepID=A0A0D7AWD6_9AGAR|nr:hypothetical protein CYLTODRAFT_427457 [Cylindrobasidium torrendii FP15055 ss-10]